MNFFQLKITDNQDEKNLCENEAVEMLL